MSGGTANVELESSLNRLHDMQQRMADTHRLHLWFTVLLLLTFLVAVVVTAFELGRLRETSARSTPPVCSDNEPNRQVEALLAGLAAAFEHKVLVVKQPKTGAVAEKR